MKPKQVSYQLYYRLRNKTGRSEFSKKLESKPEPLNFIKWISSPESYNLQAKSFSFLNIEKSFAETIDWDFPEYGQLWTYNLNYFDFLNQEGLSKEVGLSLIHKYVQSAEYLKNGLESYPLSLRGINWIKFLSLNSIQDKEIDQCLYNHYYTLYNNREYHLMGNHLLENGFSLFFGAFYFKDETLLRAATTIFESELKEQILNDGAHFELSPMYHQIILNRLLDCINLANNNQWSEFKDLNVLTSYAISMLAWLETITYQSGEVPMVNDCAWGIAPNTSALFAYAERLGLRWNKAVLSDSGYRKWKDDRYELFMDLGAIGPDYIPGHAHADTFNFELYTHNKPFIVDTGISTYEKNSLRQFERSTEAHNTVLVENENSSHVWDGFRVAERAKVTKTIENDDEIIAEHNGYKKKGVIHRRAFQRQENRITIHDNLLGNTKVSAFAFLHFHPSIDSIKIEADQLIIPDMNVAIEFKKGVRSIDKIDYNYCTAFNQTQKAIAVKVSFQEDLLMTINL